MSATRLRFLGGAAVVAGLVAIVASAQQPGPVGREGRFSGGPPVHPVVQALDADGDGELSAAELRERMKSLADTADVNRDGFIDRAELTKLAEQQAGESRAGRRPEGRRPER